MSVENIITLESPDIKDDFYENFGFYDKDENINEPEPMSKKVGKRKTGRLYRRKKKFQKDARLRQLINTTGGNIFMGYVDYDYIDEKWQPVGQYIKYARASSAQTFLKHQNNKRIRRAKNVANGSAYKKHNEYWYDLF